MQDIFNSPIGLIEIIADEEAIIKLDFIDDESELYNIELHLQNAMIEKCKKQLNEYFQGKRFDFDLPIELQCTEFQKRVWKEVSKISFGKTKSYLQIAELLGDKKLIRAVGLANGQNPLPIIVPCHRVIGSDGKLVGYAGGLQRKKWLLNHEAEFSNYEKQIEIFRQ